MAYKKEFRKQGNEEPRKFSGSLRPLMSEAEKAADRVPIDELAFDFSCRVTRMYKWLNEGKLSKADRDIVGAYGLQMLRSASSVSANLKAAVERAQCPNSFEHC